MFRTPDLRRFSRNQNQTADLRDCEDRRCSLRANTGTQYSEVSNSPSAVSTQL